MFANFISEKTPIWVCVLCISSPPSRQPFTTRFCEQLAGVGEFLDTTTHFELQGVGLPLRVEVYGGSEQVGLRV